MQCPRLEHFVRLNPTGKFGKCGHMTSVLKSLIISMTCKTANG
jgi:hypothetical protein